MFDYIDYRGKLPCNAEMSLLKLNEVAEWNLQTKDLKDLADVLSEYVVKAKILYVKKYKVSEWVENDSESNNPMDRLGHFRNEGEYLDKSDYTGELNAYTSLYDINDRWDCWLEWKFTFVKGKLVKTKLFNFKSESNQARLAARAARLERDKLFLEEIAYRNSVWYNKYLFHTIAYSWIRRKTSYILYTTGNFIASLSYKLP